MSPSASWALLSIPAVIFGYNLQFARRAQQSITHRDSAGYARQALAVASEHSSALVLVSPGVARLHSAAAQMPCGGRSGDCAVAVTETLVVVRSSEVQFGERAVAEWDSVGMSSVRREPFTGFGWLSRDALLALPAGGTLPPGRKNIEADFGPWDVNFAYYPNWIASDHVLVLSSRVLGSAICQAEVAPDRPSRWPQLEPFLCPAKFLK
jgi:hypothetical protein